MSEPIITEEAKQPTKLKAASIPVWVVEMVRKKILTMGEAYALAYIDGLVEYGGIGCWASNKHLAEQFGMTETGVSLMLKRLVENNVLINVGWVIRRGNLKFRLLETAWSRIMEPEETPEEAGERLTKLLSSNGQRVVVKLDPDCNAIRQRAINAVKGYGLTQLKGTPKRGFNSVKGDINTESNTGIKDREGGSASADSPYLGDRSSLVGNSVDKRDELLAKQLKEALQRNNRVHRGSEKNSANGFRLLREVDNQPHSHVVVAAYCGCCSREEQQRLGLPLCENGHQFRKHFEWVVSKLVAAGKLDPGWDGSSPPITVSSPVVDKLVSELTTDLSWPKGAAIQLPQVVQVSVDNYKSFRKRFYAFMDTTKDQALKRLASHVELEFTKPSLFLAEWFTQMHRSVEGWDDWSGTLTPFSEGSPKFARWGAAVAESFCGDAGRWGRLLKVVKAVQA